MQINYIYPPNYDLNPPDNLSGIKRVIVQITDNLTVSDDESDTVIVRTNEFKTVTGDVCTRFAVEKIEYAVSIAGILTLEFDRTPHRKIAELSGNGCLEFCGGLVDEGGDTGTGNILLTTDGVNSYSVTLHLRTKKEKSVVE